MRKLARQRSFSAGDVGGHIQGCGQTGRPQGVRRWLPGVRHWTGVRVIRLMRQMRLRRPMRQMRRMRPMSPIMLMRPMSPIMLMRLMSPIMLMRPWK